MKNKPSWIKEKKVSPDFEIIKCKEIESHKDFKMDKGCYVLIQIYRNTAEIGVAICSYKHKILKEFRGKRAKDIYHSIFKYNEKNKKRWFKRLDHAAYLGEELKKAEISLASGTEYYQE